MQKYAIRAHEANALSSSMEVIRFELFTFILQHLLPIAPKLQLPAIENSLQNYIKIR